jgi:chemotaxis protein CheX
MPATEEIAEELIRDNLARALSDVFKTMFNRDILLTTVDPAEAAAAAERPHIRKFSIPQVVGTVGFVGDANGAVYLHLDQPFANLCTGHILGLEESELHTVDDDSVNDAIGELTNMVVGGFKNGFSESGYLCKLTIPSILRGHDFHIESPGAARRHAYRFTCANHHLMADIIIKFGE